MEGRQEASSSTEAEWVARRNFVMLRFFFDSWMLQQNHQARWAGARTRIGRNSLPQVTVRLKSPASHPVPPSASMVYCFLSDLTVRLQTRILKILTLLLPLRTSEPNEWFWFLEGRAKVCHDWKEITVFLPRPVPVIAAWCKLEKQGRFLMRAGPDGLC